jgi:hypothetical protein
MPFKIFVDEALVAAAEATAAHPVRTDHPLLNGVPYKAFRQSIALDVRRRSGTFFSSGPVAERLALKLRAVVKPGARVMDPTCGMGDLLLGYAAQLPLRRSLDGTLRAWGEQLAGLDTREELVALAKARLVLLARARGGFSEPIDSVEPFFPLIQVGDALASNSAYSGVDGFLFNPPFGQVVDAKDALPWSTGRVNASAIFMATLLAAKRATAPIAAVLPEVLRCGTRYAAFRRHLVQNGVGGDYEPFGRFDAWTDVDVFLTLLTGSEAPLLWPQPLAVSRLTVGERFAVRVGTVVPHRHAEAGPVRSYLCARTTPAWSDSYTPVTQRAFTGTVFDPPFVVVRRTSSPSDRHRAVGSVIIGSAPVAVENHLLVLKPTTGGVDVCQELLATLMSCETTAFLNKTIRCRHLTTAAVKAIPLQASDE